MTSIVATVQVRMGSTRLPGKALIDICGKPLLGHLIERLQQAKRLDDIVIATSTEPENDAIEQYCQQRGLLCFRGDEHDVLGRMLNALQMAKADVGVEVFGDCPLIDPMIVDHAIELFLHHNVDFVGNDLTTTFPPGMEVEVFKMEALLDSAQKTNDPSIREHGTLFIRTHPEIYQLHPFEASPAECRPELEMEVDTIEDLMVIKQVIEYFHPKTDFTLAELIAFYDAHPDIVSLNQAVPRRWKQHREATVLS